MPAGDGTGPMGMGPMTGRAAGYCAGYPGPGYMNPVSGRGLGFGFGRGRGFGFGRGLGPGFRGGRGRGGWWGAVPNAGADAAPSSAPGFAGPTIEQERDALQGQVEVIEQTLDGIRKRIAELDTAKTDQK